MTDTNGAQGAIRLRGVSKCFEGVTGARHALGGIDLEVAAGEFVAIVGPSGCGKSTLLSILGGFETPSSGEVLIDGQRVCGPDPRFVTIFQDYGLLPWRSVLGNVEFGLEARRIGRAERREQALRWLDVVGLSAYAHARPSELSGGMRQRVSLARALAVRPEVVFMDEPMGALDAITRAQVQEEVLAIRSSTDATIVLVTHDIDEAVFLADRILVMTPCPGRIAEEIAVQMPHPRDRASADFASVRNRLLEVLHLVHREHVEYEI